MKAASEGAKNGQLELFREWFSKRNAAEQKDFLKKLGWAAQRLVGYDKADDLTQHTMEELLKSSHLYPHINPGLAVTKARELALAYKRRAPQGEYTDTDALADPGDDPFEVILKCEAEEEAKEADKSSVQEIYTVITPGHRNFLHSIIEMSSDLNIGQFEHKNGIYTGKVWTLTGTLSVRISPTDLNGIEYIVTVADTETEVGIAWNRTGEKKGTRYIWLKLDSPFLPAPAYCSLFEQPDGSYNLIWHRPDAHGPYCEGLTRPQFDNKNIARHLGTSVKQVQDTTEAIRRRLHRRPDITEPIKKRLRRRPISTSTIDA
jgi:uncharacterized protein (DUF736 family)